MAQQKKEELELTEAQIAVHWKEEEYYHPSAKFIGQANASDPDIFERFSEKNFPECFKEYGDLLSWDQYWHTMLDTSNPPFWKWFVGGKLNACYNCVDRHLEKNKNKAAFIWVPELENETTETITYQELYVRVNEFAALLRDFCGVKAGDRVTFHLPMVPALPVSMLACARLGVIHSQVFGGFSGAACGGRIADSGSHILVTMDGYYRNGEMLDQKIKADEAVEVAANIWPMLQAHRSIIRTFTRRTSIGASPILDGSQATPISFMVRWLFALPASPMKVCPPTRMPGGPGG